MYKIRIEESFDSAHFLAGYDGKCSNLHGHRTLKPLTIQALKEENFRLIEVPFRPTAENFAKFFYEEMTAKGYAVYEMAVYETPNNCAVYSEV